MRLVESKIKKEGLVLALFDEGERTLGHELGKVLAGGLHRGGSLVQVVKARAMKKVVVVVVDEPVPDPEELVEALSRNNLHEISQNVKAQTVSECCTWLVMKRLHSNQINRFLHIGFRCKNIGETRFFIYGFHLNITVNLSVSYTGSMRQ